TEIIVDDRTARIKGGLAGIAVARVLLQCALDRHAAGPHVGDLARDDVDDATHRIGTVERGHRTAHDLDPFDCADWRDEALLVSGAPIRAGVTCALALAV